MTTLYAAVAGRRVVAADIRIPWVGTWTADLAVDEVGAALTGRVTVTLGGLSLVGTVDDVHAGAWAEGRGVRVVGGAGGWGKALPPKGHHNDAGVKLSTVLSGAALEAGETLSLAAALETRIGVDFVRDAGPASAVFAAAAPAALWWVDPAGVTQVAASRASSEVAKGADLELLDFDPIEGRAELAGDPAAVPIGTVLRFPGRLPAPMVVRELALLLDEERLRISAWSRATEAGGRLLDPFLRLARRVRDERLPGLYRYRVVAMSVDRAKLQAVTPGRWPDVLPCSLGAGLAGGWAQLAPGAEVLVAFEDEDRARPVIAGYTPKGRPGHVPALVSLVADEVLLGADAEKGVVRADDIGAGPVIAAAGNAITITNPDGSTVILTDVNAASSWAVTGTASPPGQMKTKAVGCSATVKAGD